MRNIRTELGNLIKETREQARNTTDPRERDRLEERASLWQEVYDGSADNARGHRS
jgi:hypothetical protein